MSLRHTSLLIALALEDGLTINTPRDPEQRGGTVAVDCPHASAISEALIQRGFSSLSSFRNMGDT